MLVSLVKVSIALRFFVFSVCALGHNKNFIFFTVGH